VSYVPNRTLLNLTLLLLAKRGLLAEVISRTPSLGRQHFGANDDIQHRVDQRG
jgi:hypothetical protein